MSPLENYWNNILFHSVKVILPIMIFPLLVALFYRKYWNKSLNILFFYILLTFLFNLVEQVLVSVIRNYPQLFDTYINSWGIENSFFLQILFYWNNLLLISLFYSKIFPNKFYKSLLIKLGCILTILVSINFFFIEGYKSQGILNPSVNAIFLVFIPLIYLWVSQNTSLRISLTKNPYFWISMGIIIPNLVSSFLYFSGDYIYGNNFIMFAKLQIMKNIFLVIGQILIAIGFYHSYYARFIKIA